MKNLGDFYSMILEDMGVKNCLFLQHDFGGHGRVKIEVIFTA